MSRIAGRIDRRIELVKRIQAEMDRRTEIENLSESFICDGIYKDATALLESLDDSIIQNMRMEEEGLEGEQQEEAEAEQEKLVESLVQVDFSDLQLPAIVVYKNPKDCPDAYIARAWEGAMTLPTDIFIKRETLQEIRKDIKAAGFSIRFTRQQGDDPVIVETWV